MESTELLIVVPFINEYPQILFTLRGVAGELKGEGISFRVIAVDNWCKEVERQGRTADRGHELVQSLSNGTSWLRVLQYDTRMSHWQAKNLAVQSSSAPFLFFLDAHCMIAKGALTRMFRFYKENWESLNGSIHLPLTYHILEEKKLIYGLTWDKEKGDVHYTFVAARRNISPQLVYEVPCMSTCGMMIHRSLYEDVGGWPKNLGIYGGGENFFNFSLSVMGKQKWVFGEEPVYHHGEKRGYNWNALDYEKNRIIATYIFGGEELATRFVEKREKAPNKRILWGVYQDVLRESVAHRKRILKKTLIPIEEWADTWRES